MLHVCGVFVVHLARGFVLPKSRASTSSLRGGFCKKKRSAKQKEKRIDIHKHTQIQRQREKERDTDTHEDTDTHADIEVDVQTDIQIQVHKCIIHRYMNPASHSTNPSTPHHTTPPYRRTSRRDDDKSIIPSGQAGRLASLFRPCRAHTSSRPRTRPKFLLSVCGALPSCRVQCDPPVFKKNEKEKNTHHTHQLALSLFQNVAYVSGLTYSELAVCVLGVLLRLVGAVLSVTSSALDVILSGNTDAIQIRKRHDRMIRQNRIISAGTHIICLYLSSSVTFTSRYVSSVSELRLYCLIG